MIITLYYKIKKELKKIMTKENNTVFGEEFKASILLSILRVLRFPFLVFSVLLIFIYITKKELNYLGAIAGTIIILFFLFAKVIVRKFMRMLSNIPFYAQKINIERNYIVVKKFFSKKLFTIDTGNIDHVKNFTTSWRGSVSYIDKFEVFMKSKESYVFDISFFSDNDIAQITEYLLSFNVEKNQELIKNINEQNIKTEENSVQPKIENIKAEENSVQSKIENIKSNENLEGKYIFLSKKNKIINIFMSIVLLFIILSTLKSGIYSLKNIILLLLSSALFVYYFLIPVKLIFDIDKKTIVQKNSFGINIQKISIDEIVKIIIINEIGIKLKIELNSGVNKIIEVNKFRENKSLSILNVLSKMFNKELVFEIDDKNTIL